MFVKQTIVYYVIIISDMFRSPFMSLNLGLALNISYYGLHF